MNHMSQVRYNAATFLWIGDQIRVAGFAVALQQGDQMRLEVSLGDVHPVRHKIPHHVPKTQIGERADEAHPRFKPGVRGVIEVALEGLGGLSIHAHLDVCFWE